MKVTVFLHGFLMVIVWSYVSLGVLMHDTVAGPCWGLFIWLGVTIAGITWGITQANKVED
jgi:hypothetical protein